MFVLMNVLFLITRFSTSFDEKPQFEQKQNKSRLQIIAFWRWKYGMDGELAMRMSVGDRWRKELRVNSEIVWKVKQAWQNHERLLSVVKQKKKKLVKLQIYENKRIN